MTTSRRGYRIYSGWTEIAIVLLGRPVRAHNHAGRSGSGQSDGLARIRGARRDEFGTEREFNRYSDTSRFVVVVVAVAAGASRAPVPI